jgi:hypothetical protein
MNDACDDDVDAGAHAWNYAQRTTPAPTKTPAPPTTYNPDMQPLGI